VSNLVLELLPWNTECNYIVLLNVLSLHCKWVPCPHVMMRPQVADGGDGLQIWRFAANTWINSRGQPTRNGSPSWRLGGKLTTRHHNKPVCYEMLRRGLDFDRFFGTT